MEKLQPILKQKFWILLGITIIMALTGWWMATSTMLKAITDRTTQIKAAEKKAEVGAVPNENWAKELDGLNEKQEKAIASARIIPWKQQQAKMMIWPEGVETQGGYWGKFNSVSRAQIRLTYPDEVRKVWKMVNPFDRNNPDGTGIVDFAFKNMYEILKRGKWTSANGPADETVWELKEDLWLLERLFQSITNVNGGMDTTQNDAAIHTIDHLQLRGGGGPKVAAKTGGGGGSTPPGGGLAGLSGRRGGGRGEDDEVSGGYIAAAGNTQKTSAEFDPTEELGSDGSAGVSGPSTGGPLAGGATTAAKSVGERYVAKDENLPYKTRGFYLSVKMDHRKIPEFIAELTAGENTILPIQILRVQMSRLHDDEVVKVVEGTNSTRPNVTGIPNPQPMRQPQRGKFGGGLGGPGGGTLGNQEDADEVGGRMGRPGGRRGGNIGGAMPAAAADPIDKARQDQINLAEATLKKVLADPNMAQVTICGVFLLYKKVDETVDPNASPGTATPTDATATKSVNETPAESASESAEEPAASETAAEMSDETAVETANPAETTSTPDPNGDPAGEPSASPDPAEPKPGDPSGEEK